jgi:hypothetical protein
MDWKGKLDLDKEEASTAFWYQCILIQVPICVFSLPLVLLAIFVRQWGLKGQIVLLFLVLNVKGGEIKAKATRLVTTCDFFQKF